jgi:hypothetical protein
MTGSAIEGRIALGLVGAQPKGEEYRSVSDYADTQEFVKVSWQLGWPNDPSFDTSTGPILDFHEVTFLTHSGILRIDPVRQAETVGVDITTNVDLRYVSITVGEHRRKLNTQHRNSLLWFYVEAC